MPGFLFPDQEPQIQPYQAPSELMLKSAMYRDAKFKEGLQNIRSKYDNILSLQLTNPGNQQFVRDQVRAAVDQLDKYKGADVSLPENQGAIMSLFDPITDDQGVMTDVAFTQHMNGQKAIINKLSQDHPELVRPANVFPLLQAEQQYRSGNRTSTPNFVSYQPYHDYEKGNNELLGKLKEDISRDPDVIYTKDPVTGETIGLRGEREIKSISQQRIKTALGNTMDSQQLNQMMLDYNYNKANGVYNQQGAIVGIDQDMKDIRPAVENLKRQLEAGGLTASEITQHQNQIQIGEAELARLGKLKFKIASDPAAVSEYYSFNKYLSDYVDGKAQEFSYTQQGKFEESEFDKNAYKYNTDIALETLKAKLKVQEELAKGFSGGDTTTGKNADGSYIIEPPLKKYEDRIAAQGYAQIDWQNPEILPLLGNARRDSDGNIIYINTGGGDTDPDKQIIIKAGSESIDPQSANLLKVNTLIGSTIAKLDSINYPGFTKKVSYGSAHSDSVLGELNSGANTSSTAPMTQEEKVIKLQELIDRYNNPGANEGPNNALSKYGRSIVAPLAESLKSLGVNTLTSDAIAQYNQFAHSDKGQSMVALGTILNKDAKGQYQFVPDGSKNLTRFDNGKLGVSGYLSLTADDINRTGLPLKAMLASGVITQVAPDVVMAQDGNKAVKQVTNKYWVPVVLPTNTDSEDVNRQMFESGAMKQFPESQRYQANQMQAAAYRDYAQTTQYAATQLMSVGESLYKPRPGSTVQKQVDDLFKTLDSNRDITPQQNKDIRDHYDLLLRQPQTPADLINNIQTFIQNTQSTINPSSQQLDASQIAIMQKIQRIGQEVGASPRDIQTAIVTAMTESGLGKALTGDNGEAFGVFQQHPGTGWGTQEDVMNPDLAIRKFFLGTPKAPGLLSIKNREAIDIPTLAQRVQRSAYADGSNYKKWADIFKFK